MKKLPLLLSMLMLMLWPNRPVFAFNPIKDLQDNVAWTFGRTAEIGTSVKLGGAGDLDKGQTTTSFLAGIAEYRFLALSYGGTRINKSNSDLTDTAKIGIRLGPILNWFHNPPTPQMAILQNINVGPSMAMSVFSNPHAATFFFDLNYQFGTATRLAQ